jgi:hypothetical protein
MSRPKGKKNFTPKHIGDARHVMARDTCVTTWFATCLTRRGVWRGEILGVGGGVIEAVASVIGVGGAALPGTELVLGAMR